MNNPLANLSPLERRFVVGVGVVIFVILNVVFVRPRFQDRLLVQSRLANATRKLEDFSKAITNAAPLEKEIAALEKQGDAQLPQEEQSAEFIKTIQNAAIQTGVNIVSMQRSTTRTNDQFFIEQAQTTRLTAKEENLVNFLHLLSAGNSLVSIRDLVMRPDQPRYLLNVDLKAVASFQKKPPVRSGASGPSPSPAPASVTRSNRP